MEQQTTNDKLQNIFGIWFFKAGICLGFCCLILGFTSGCAKTVTPVDFGQTMTVTVTLRGNANPFGNRYFLVLGHDSTFSTPRPPAQDGRNFEFLEPDVAPYGLAHTADEYFTYFFNTWDGYIVLDSSQSFSLVHGPFVQGATVTRTPIQTFSGGTNILSFYFTLNQIYTSLSGVPANAWFNVVSVSWPPSGSGPRIAADNLTTNTYINTMSGSGLTINDSGTYAAPTDASLDIQTVVVKVQ